MSAASFIPVTGGEEGVTVVGVSARWPPWPLGGLPLTLPPSVGGGATAPTTACVDLVERHFGGGVPFEKLSKGLHSGSSRGSLAAELGLRLLHRGDCGCDSSPFGFLPSKSRLGFAGLLQPSLLRFQRRQLRLRLGPLLSDLPSRGLDGVLLGGVRLGLSRRFGVGPFLRLLLCPLLGKRLFQRLHLGLLAGNGLLRQAGFLVGCRHLTLDLGSRCLMGGCGRESSRNGRHGRGVDGHAMLPLRSLLLGDAVGALHGSVLLRGPLPGNRKVAGHPTGALTGARHVPLVGSSAAGAGLVGRRPPAVGRPHVAAGA